MFCIISSNSKLETIAWGPFKTLKHSKTMRKRLEAVYPRANHLILEFQDYSQIPELHDKVNSDD